MNEENKFYYGNRFSISCILFYIGILLVLPLCLKNSGASPTFIYVLLPCIIILLIVGGIALYIQIKKKHYLELCGREILINDFGTVTEILYEDIKEIKIFHDIGFACYNINIYTKGEEKNLISFSMGVFNDKDLLISILKKKGVSVSYNS